MATSTISNTILDPSGTAVASVTVTARLKPQGGFREDTFTEVTRQESTTSDVNGAWSLTLEENDNITPTGTYWEITEDIPDSAGGPTTYAVSVGASDQTVYAALVSSLPNFSTGSYLTQASADARYQALGSLGAATLPITTTGVAGTASSAARSDHQHGFQAAVLDKGLYLATDGKANVRVGDFFTATATIGHAPGYRSIAVNSATTTAVTVKTGDLWVRTTADVQNGIQQAIDPSTWRKPWNLPWGEIAYTSFSSNAGAIATTSTTVTAVTTSVVLTANRKIKVLVVFPSMLSSTGLVAWLQLLDGANAALGSAKFQTGAAERGTTIITYRETTSAGAKTFKVVGFTSTGTLTPEASSGGAHGPMFMLIEDIGPSGAPA